MSAPDGHHGGQQTDGTHLTQGFLDISNDQSHWSWQIRTRFTYRTMRALLNYDGSHRIVEGNWGGERRLMQRSVWGSFDLSTQQARLFQVPVWHNIKLSAEDQG